MIFMISTTSTSSSSSTCSSRFFDVREISGAFLGQSKNRMGMSDVEAEVAILIDLARVRSHAYF